MGDEIRSAVCNGCGKQLDEAYNLPERDRTPCPDCGSLSRALQISVSDRAETHDRVELKHKMPGRKDPIAEVISGDDYHHSSGTWRNLLRVIDRGKNWYEKTVRDRLTGEILYHQGHPLDEHTGHGSDKRNLRH